MIVKTTIYIHQPELKVHVAPNGNNVRFCYNDGRFYYVDNEVLPDRFPFLRYFIAFQQQSGRW